MLGGIFLGVRGPRDWIFTIVLTIWILERPNLTWRRSLLLGRAYPGPE
jgi:hypothetical protein